VTYSFEGKKRRKQEKNRIGFLVQGGEEKEGAGDYPKLGSMIKGETNPASISSRSRRKRGGISVACFQPLVKRRKKESSPVSFSG